MHCCLYFLGNIEKINTITLTEAQNSIMIDFNAYWSLIYYFLLSHKLIAVGIGIAIAFFCYRKPAEAIKFFGFCALIVTALYIMSMLSEKRSD